MPENYQVKEQPVSDLQAKPRDMKLEQRVAKFISLICNVSMMKQQMMEIGLLIYSQLSAKYHDTYHA